MNDSKRMNDSKSSTEATSPSDKELEAFQRGAKAARDELSKQHTQRWTTLMFVIVLIGPFATCSVRVGWHLGGIFSRLVGIVP